MDRHENDRFPGFEGKNPGDETRFVSGKESVSWIPQAYRLNDRESDHEALFGNRTPDGFLIHFLSDSNRGSCVHTPFEADQLDSNPLFECALVGMSVHALDGRFLKANGFFYGLLGEDAGEFSTRILGEMIRSEGWDESEEHPFPDENRNGSQTNRVVFLDGSRKPFLVSRTAILDKRKEVTGYLLQWMHATSSGKDYKAVRHALEEDRGELLKEIHHRVKNNLQVVSSLLNLQSRLVRDPETVDLFRTSQDRILAMALVHEKLYTSNNFSKVDFSGYIHSLFKSLCRNHYDTANDILLNIDLEEMDFPIRIAIPCGLILNELLSNAIKHAFSESSADTKTIEVSLKKDAGGDIVLTVRDNGGGMPRHFDMDQTKSLGLSLVFMITKDQLDGHIDLPERESGTEIRIHFRI